MKKPVKKAARSHVHKSGSGKAPKKSAHSRKAPSKAPAKKPTKTSTGSKAAKVKRPHKPAQKLAKKKISMTKSVKKLSVAKPAKHSTAKKPQKHHSDSAGTKARVKPSLEPPPPIDKAPEMPAKNETPTAKAVSSALKGKLLELQKRTALKRSRLSPMFSFEDAAEVLRSRKGTLKIFKPLELEAVKKVQKKQNLLPKIKQRSVGAASLDDILGMGAAPAKRIVRKDPEISEVPPKFRRHYRLLLDMRKRVSEGLDVRTKDTLKRSTKEDSGDLASYSSDSGTDTFDRDFALNLVSSEQDLLFEIDQAIKRLGDGTYGICEITGKQIPADRLLAVPFTRYSLEGQKELEGSGRIRKTYIEPPTNLTETGEEDAPTFADDDEE